MGRRLSLLDRASRAGLALPLAFGSGAALVAPARPAPTTVPRAPRRASFSKVRLFTWPVAKLQISVGLNLSCPPTRCRLVRW